MKSNCNHWSFKHEFYPSTFPTMMIEAECGACGRLSFFVAEGFDQSANYCSYCGALNAATRWTPSRSAEVCLNCALNQDEDACAECRITTDDYIESLGG